MAMTATAGFLNESQVLLERLAKNRWRSQSVARAAAESIPVLGTMAIFGGSSVGCALTTAASFPSGRHAFSHLLSVYFRRYGHFLAMPRMGAAGAQKKSAPAPC